MLVDLSVLISEDTPVWSTDPKVEIRVYETFENNNCKDEILALANHTGTHIDAPSHMIKGAKNLEDFPLEKFKGRGVCIKTEGEFSLEKIKQVEIKDGDIVFFYTGMGEKFFQKEYFESYPVMSQEVVEYLIEKRVKAVGVDTPSVDGEIFTNHQTLLKKDILIIENLTNLASLEGKEFTVYAFPLKLALDGSPVRVVAEMVE